jgi:predicted  nucleic acid-binding Zn-ribbon protein
MDNGFDPMTEIDSLERQIRDATQRIRTLEEQVDFERNERACEVQNLRAEHAEEMRHMEREMQAEIRDAVAEAGWAGPYNERF